MMWMATVEAPSGKSTEIDFWRFHVFCRAKLAWWSSSRDNFEIWLESLANIFVEWFPNVSYVLLPSSIGIHTYEAYVSCGVG